jgi:hypothetical protein
MLTGNLLAYTRRGGRIHPRRVDPADPALREAAERLLGLFQSGVGGRRGELEETLRGSLPTGAQARVARGLAKLLWERCAFAAGGAADPWALRQAVFDGAALAWRRQGRDGLAEWRQAVLEDAARTLAALPAAAPPEAVEPGEPPEPGGPASLPAPGPRPTAQAAGPAEAVEAALYGDLEENQVLTGFDTLPPERLLLRYNVANVQGLLLRARRLELRAAWPTPQRLRQLLRWLKFFGLLFQAQADAPDTRAPELCLAVDGPLSVLEGGTRYGLNLAQFFPALLLWDAPWRLRAVVRVGPSGGPGRPESELLLEPHPHLRSHYPDHGQWVPDEVLRFVAAFNLGEGPWRAAPAERVLTLPGNAYLVPDFEFTHGGSGRVVALEHVTHPAPARLQTILERVARHVPGAYLLAFRQAVGLPDSPWALAYRRSLLPSQVRARLEEVAGE